VSAVLRTRRGIAVLLVDDQPIIGEAVARMLAGEPGIRFQHCRDPARAIATAVEMQATVILQDLVMPDSDGLTLLGEYRAHAATRDLPVIMLSTRQEPEVKAEAFARGANDYVVKLPDRMELVARIRHHSRGYIGLLDGRDAWEALVETQKQLEASNRFIRQTFGRYLSDEVVAQLLETEGGLTLGGELRRVTILMADLRNFTPLCETLPPEKVVALLNNHLGLMSDIVVKFGGTVDEFIGDAILAIFGAPLFGDDDARRAVACAVAMQLGMDTVNERNRAAGLPSLEMGIGLDTGATVVGNIGSDRRAKYGVVGSHVTFASRLGARARGGHILASRATVGDAGVGLSSDGELTVEVPGMEPLFAYDVVGIGVPYNLFLARSRSP
jgi:adenylate cyclase